MIGQGGLTALSTLVLYAGGLRGNGRLVWLLGRHGRQGSHRSRAQCGRIHNTAEMGCSSGCCGCRVYSPITFGQKYDKNGDFIRHFVPVLKDFPAKYIYEPWTAPADVQKKAKCIIGKDYPKPLVDHKEVSNTNKARMKEAYALGKSDKDSAKKRGRQSDSD